jgi:glycosyltransferase domain-containing protein
VSEAPRDPRVTLLLPTMNRPDFVLRLLRYYAGIRFQGRIIIGDSSLPVHVEETRRGLTPFVNTLDIDYEAFPGLGLADCWKQLIDRTTTSYAAYLADDDFLVPRSLDACARFLDEHPDYAAAHGAGLGITLDSHGLHGQVVQCDYYRQTISEADRPSERLSAHLDHYTVTLFAVHRTETWRLMFKDVHAIPDMSFGAELLPCCLSVVYGKVKELPGLYVVRQTHDRRYNQPTMFDWIASDQWFPSYQATLNSLANALVSREGIGIDDARRLVHDGFRRYVGGGMGLPSRWTNGGPAVAVARKLWHAWRAMQPLPHSEFQLSELLKSSSPYHADFMPVYQSLIAPPSKES